MSAFLELLPYRISQSLCNHWPQLRYQPKRPAKPTAGQPRRTGKPKLYIDMAVISHNDAGTGIQRVVKAIALALLENNPQDWEVSFVSATRKRPYHEISWPDQSIACDKTLMKAHQGDVFIGLDYSIDAVRRHKRQLKHFRRDGGAIWFLVHDLLPFHHPEWFSQNTVIRYKAWLTILANISDGFLCNSTQTEAKLIETLSQHFGVTGYETAVLPMGHLLPVATEGPAPRANPRFDTTQPFALMVGTLEPRKGHQEVIGAFEHLWERGHQARLILVGRLGWQVSALHNHIITHPEFGAKLIWFNDVEDLELHEIYQACTGVIVASIGEGFGLPIVEALGYEKPVLARDLPVFRPHQERGLIFFPNQCSNLELSHHIESWFRDASNGKIAVTIPSESWTGSAKTLLKAISAQQQIQAISTAPLAASPKSNSRQISAVDPRECE